MMYAGFSPMRTQQRPGTAKPSRWVRRTRRSGCAALPSRHSADPRHATDRAIGAGRHDVYGGMRFARFILLLCATAVLALVLAWPLPAFAQDETDTASPAPLANTQGD